MIKKKYALISVYDKTGIEPLARKLNNLGVEIFSTGGTKKVLEENGMETRSISELTGFPEILDGRVKTLHPNIHAGILAKRNKQKHIQEIGKFGIEFIDIVVCNLYPFEKTISSENIDLETALEMIDIGGPTMVRAAAKNFQDVVVIVNPQNYQIVIEELERAGGVSFETRKKLAIEAFQHTAYYDTIIANYLTSSDKKVFFPNQMTIGLEKIQDLRYGENPHQTAAFYREGILKGLTKAKKYQGKEISFNNILDAEAALNFVLDFEEPTISIIKHVNPCGIATRKSILEAFQAALAGDSLSAYGGIIGSNRVIDETVATEIIKSYFEVIIAPGYTEKALEIFKAREKLRILEIPDWEEEKKDLTTYKIPSGLDYRRVRGGLLVQTRDLNNENPTKFEVISQKKPSIQEMEDLLYAWKIVGRIKSNAIVFVKKTTLVGIGAGQMSRVVSVEIAAKKAGEKAYGAVMASDAYFPFSDGIEAAAKAGITAVIQPGGSIRDEEVLKKVDELGLAMVKTGVRHFLH